MVVSMGRVGRFKRLSAVCTLVVTHIEHIEPVCILGVCV